MAFLPENIFAKIIAKEIPAKIVYENDRVLAFHDIAPKAKTHILIIPKEEIKTAHSVSENNKNLFGELFLAAKEISILENVSDYKLFMNVGENAGQVVPHVHLHFLSPDFQSEL
jgi:histidine triad (HIT) family protein